MRTPQRGEGEGAWSGPLTLHVNPDAAHVGLQVLTDGGEEVVVGVQVADDLVAVVEVVGARVVSVVHGRLGGGGGREGEKNEVKLHCT